MTVTEDASPGHSSNCPGETREDEATALGESADRESSGWQETQLRQAAAAKGKHATNQPEKDAYF